MKVSPSDRRRSVGMREHQERQTDGLSAGSFQIGSFTLHMCGLEAYYVGRDKLANESKGRASMAEGQSTLPEFPALCAAAAGSVKEA